MGLPIASANGDVGSRDLRRCRRAVAVRWITRCAEKAKRAPSLILARRRSKLGHRAWPKMFPMADGSRSGRVEVAIVQIDCGRVVVRFALELQHGEGRGEAKVAGGSWWQKTGFWVNCVMFGQARKELLPSCCSRESARLTVIGWFGRFQPSYLPPSLTELGRLERVLLQSLDRTRLCRTSEIWGHGGPSTQQ
jgi:hypothetical protein